MKKKNLRLELLLILVTLFSFACSLTNVPSSLENEVTSTQEPTAISEVPITLPEQVTSIPLLTATEITCQVTAQVLHLRECAGMDCTVRGWLEYGETLTILSSMDNWIEVVNAIGQTGWVNSSFCGGDE